MSQIDVTKIVADALAQVEQTEATKVEIVSSEEVTGSSEEDMIKEVVKVILQAKRAEETGRLVKGVLKLDASVLGEVTGLAIKALREARANTRSGIKSAKAGFVSGYRKNNPATEKKAKTTSVRDMVKNLTPEQKAALVAKLGK